MISLLWHVLSLVGCLAFGALALVGLLTLVAWAMPGAGRDRALPRGTASGQPRVTDPELKSAHAFTNAADAVHRRELAEGRAAC